jgi:hypothetical protein
MKWAKDNQGRWHELFSLELCDKCLKDVIGIYVVFYRMGEEDNGQEKFTVLKLGQGHIKTKLLELRKDPEMIGQKSRHPLVTWMPVHPMLLDKIERILSKNLDPIREF